MATAATMVLDDPTGYGRVVRAADGSVARVVETKHPGDATPEELALHEVNAGVYAFDAAALRGALDRLRTDNAQGELYLPDVLRLLSDDGGRVAAHVVDDPTLLLGVNDRVELARVRALAQARIVEAHQRAGVTVVDPASTVIEVGVRLGADTVVEPSTYLRGTTVAGERCVLGPLTTVDSATLGDDVRAVHSYLQGPAEVGAGREHRPLRLPAPGHGAARGGEGRHVRRGQELRDRRGHEGPAPLLHRRRRRRPGDEPRRLDDHRELRRRSASTARRSAPACARSVDTTFVAPVTLGRRRLHGAPARSSSTTSRRARWASRASASATSRATRPGASRPRRDDA